MEAMSDSTTTSVEAGTSRPAPRGPGFSPFAPRLEPFEPGISEAELPDDDPTETMDRPDDDDEAPVGPR